VVTVIPLPTKKYNIIYADPAWKYNDTGSIKSIDDKYLTLETEELCKLPIQDLADKDCVLLMWVTYPKLPDGLRLMQEWGFKYKTVAFTWVKMNKDKPSPFVGMGMWTRSNAEICLLGVKGNPKRANLDVQQVILSKIRKHSQKPDEVYTRIERLMGDLPRVELFAREKREGWDVWGNQIPNSTQLILSVEEKMEVKSGCDANDDGIPPNNKLLGILPNEL